MLSNSVNAENILSKQRSKRMVGTRERYYTTLYFSAKPNGVSIQS